MEESNPGYSEFFQSEMSGNVEDKFSDNDKQLVMEEPEPISVELNIGIPEFSKEEAPKPEKNEKNEKKQESQEELKSKEVPKPEVQQKMAEKEESKDLPVQISADDKKQEIQIPMRNQPANDASSNQEETKIQIEQKPGEFIPVQIEEINTTQEQSTRKKYCSFITGIRIFSHVLVLTAAGYVVYKNVLKNIKA